MRAVKTGLAPVALSEEMPEWFESILSDQRLNGTVKAIQLRARAKAEYSADGDEEGQDHAKNFK